MSLRLWKCRPRREALETLHLHTSSPLPQKALTLGNESFKFKLVIEKKEKEKCYIMTTD